MKKLLILLIALLPLAGSAQDKIASIKLKNGTTIKGVIKSIDPTDAVVVEVAGVETKIKMDNISDIEDQRSTNITNNTSYTPLPESEPKEEVELVAVEVEDPLKDYKGFLLERGNNVYVYFNNSDEDKEARYDKEAADLLNNLLKKDGFWNVVDHMNQAHFSINYYVDTHWHDRSSIAISSWRTGGFHPLGVHGSNESVDDNKELAEKFYYKEIKSLQKKIKEGKLSKKIIDKFTIK